VDNAEFRWQLENAVDPASRKAERNSCYTNPAYLGTMDVKDTTADRPMHISTP